MDGADRAVARRPSFKERLGLKALACCGATSVLGIGPATAAAVVAAGGDEEEQEIRRPRMETDPTDNGPAPPCGARPQASSGMNLAAALAAERQMRSAQGGSEDVPAASGDRSPERMSLMRLLEEREEEEEAGPGWVCCVCMGRRKGAAFIPCGHTFCRVCSRELWRGRGSCPLCNRPILEILDIY